MHVGCVVGVCHTAAALFYLSDDGVDRGKELDRNMFDPGVLPEVL
jgi:hypothetical protein